MTYPSFSVGEVLTAADMNAVGLWQITRKTATTGTEVLFDSVFTSNFKSYFLIVEQVTTAAVSAVNIQLRAGGSNAGGGNYYWGGIYRLFATGGGDNIQNGATFWNVGTVSSSLGSFQVNFSQPQVASYTYVNAAASNFDGYQTGGGLHNLTTSYDGFRIYTPTSSFTDVKAVLYGYNKG